MPGFRPKQAPVIVEYLPFRPVLMTTKSRGNVLSAVLFRLRKARVRMLPDIREILGSLSCTRRRMLSTPPPPWRGSPPALRTTLVRVHDAGPNTPAAKQCFHHPPPLLDRRIDWRYNTDGRVAPRRQIFRPRIQKTFAGPTPRILFLFLPPSLSSLLGLQFMGPASRDWRLDCLRIAGIRALGINGGRDSEHVAGRHAL